MWGRTVMWALHESMRVGVADSFVVVVRVVKNASGLLFEQALEPSRIPTLERRNTPKSAVERLQAPSFPFNERSNIPETSLFVKPCLSPITA